MIVLTLDQFVSYMALSGNNEVVMKLPRDGIEYKFLHTTPLAEPFEITVITPDGCFLFKTNIADYGESIYIDPSHFIHLSHIEGGKIRTGHYIFRLADGVKYGT